MITNDEWESVLDALVRGGLRECIDEIIASRGFVPISMENRRIIEEAYDDGNDNTVDLTLTDDPPWFAGMWDEHEVMLGVEHGGVLYSVVHASGGGLVSVIEGRGLLDNEVGVVFRSVGEAKAYVKGLTAK